MPFRLKWDHWQTAVLALLLLSGALLLRPFENILGGRDGGVYVNTGVNIAHTGAIAVPDPLFLSIPRGVRGEFLWTLPGPEMAGITFRFPGLYWIEERGIMLPQFLHLYPTCIAILFATLGLSGGLLVASSSAWLAGLGVYLVGRELFRERIGLTALALLAVNMSQVWFGRYANSESLFQLFFWGAVFFCVSYFRYHRPLHAAISGLGFGACLLTKIEAVLLLLPIAAVVVYVAWNGERRAELKWFVLPLALLVGWALLHSVLFSYRYVEMWSIASTGYPLSPMAIMLALAGGASAAGAIAGTMVWAFKRWTFWLSIRSRLAGPCPLGIAIPALAVAISCLFLRVGLSKLAWYVTPLGLALAAFGVVLALYREPSEAEALLIACFLLYALVFLRAGMISPDHIWAVRRFVPIVIPSAALYIAHSLSWLAGDGALWIRGLRSSAGQNSSTRRGGKVASRSRMIRVGVSTILGGMIFAYSVYTTGPLVLHREFGLAISQVQELATLLPENSLVIVDGSWVGNYVSLPLRFLHNRRMLAFWPTPGDRMTFDVQALEKVADIGLAEKWPVYFLSSVEVGAPSQDLEFILVRSSWMHFPQLEHSADHLPRRVEPWDLPYWFYEIGEVPGSRAG